MLKLENVKKQYKDFTLDCSLQVKEGCITGLIGANGAGKSTTFKAILGLIHMDGGNAELFGKPVQKLSVKDKERIGVVLSDSGFSGYLTIKDIIAILRNMYPRFEQAYFEKQIREASARLNFKAALEKYEKKKGGA